VLIAEGLNVYALDAAPSLVEAFRRNLPNTPAVCEAVEDSSFFDRTFDGVLAWGLMFLLSPDEQSLLLRKMAGIFDAPWTTAVYITTDAIGVERCDDGM
jgi:hypothetical protein